MLIEHAIINLSPKLRNFHQVSGSAYRCSCPVCGDSAKDHTKTRGNFYFDQKKPWQLIKTNKEKCSTTLNICFKIVNALAIFIASYLPFSSQKIWEMLGNKNNIKEKLLRFTPNQCILYLRLKKYIL